MIYIHLYILQLFSLPLNYCLCVFYIHQQKSIETSWGDFILVLPQIFCLIALKIMFFHLMLGTYNHTVINKCKKILYSLCHPAVRSLPISRDGVLIPQLDCTSCYHFYCFFFQGCLILPRRHSGAPTALYISRLSVIIKIH